MVRDFMQRWSVEATVEDSRAQLLRCAMTLGERLAI
jgi:hypothetical protein